MGSLSPSLQPLQKNIYKSPFCSQGSAIPVLSSGAVPDALLGLGTLRETSSEVSEQRQGLSRSAGRGAP